MTRLAQKIEEQTYTGKFLRNQLNLNVTELKPAIQEPPDCSATINNKDGTTIFLYFEIAEYFVDIANRGGSSIKRVSSFWDKVNAILIPQLERLQLTVDVRVRFSEPILLESNQLVPFVDELVSFAREYCPRGNLERATFMKSSLRSYPLLYKFVQQIDLTYLEGIVALIWQCSNITAAFIGIDQGYLANLIREKSSKNFTWGEKAEKCLLIYASGDTVTSRAGPLPPDVSIWDDLELVAVCRSSVFDRIYFWECVQGWHKRLK